MFKLNEYRLQGRQQLTAITASGSATGAATETAATNNQIRELIIVQRRNWRTYSRQ
jgi:hypothetical protein